MKMKVGLYALALAALAAASPALADIKVGVTLSATGPAAALGVPVRNAFEFWPKEIAGEKVQIIILDDAGDPGQAVTNARRLVSEDKVDILVGGVITPVSLAVSGVAAESETVQFACSPIPWSPEKHKWTFVMPQAVSLMAKGVFDHMKKNNVKTIGFIGFSDSWGDLWVTEHKKQGEPAGIKMTVEERYARADTSVAGQALKVVAAKPDAVLIAASGTGAALPQIALRERGFTGLIYQTHGAVSNDFLRIAGKSAEGLVLPSGPPVVAELQPDSAPTKKPGLDLVKQYEAKHGAASRNQFAGHSYDVSELMKRVVPIALKKGKPGTKEFRAAIREALESEKDIAASHGVYNFTPTDHFGIDDRGRVMLTVKNGKWELIK